MVQLDGGVSPRRTSTTLPPRHHRNNRLKRLLDLGAPEIIANNEKRMRQPPTL
jgi:DNA-directed RNA polymerase beta' subunit